MADNQINNSKINEIRTKLNRIKTKLLELQNYIKEQYESNPYIFELNLYSSTNLTLEDLKNKINDLLKKVNIDINSAKYVSLLSKSGGLLVNKLPLTFAEKLNDYEENLKRNYKREKNNYLEQQRNINC